MLAGMMARPRATSCADKFWADEPGNPRPEALAGRQAGLGILEHLAPPKIFTLGNIDHFLGDHPGARPFKLRDTGRRACSLPPCGGGLGRGVAR